MSIIMYCIRSVGEGISDYFNIFHMRPVVSASRVILSLLLTPIKNIFAGIPAVRITIIVVGGSWEESSVHHLPGKVNFGRPFTDFMYSMYSILKIRSISI